MIEDEVFYNLDNFYIASLAHCYPGKDKMVMTEYLLKFVMKHG